MLKPRHRIILLCSEEFYDHPLPFRPVVPRAIAPDVERMRDSLRRHDAGEALIFLQANIPLSGREYDFHAVHRRIVEVWQKIGRAIVIAIVVVITVEELVDIESSA